MENTIKETTRLLAQGIIKRDEADKILLVLFGVSGMLLSDYAKEKLEYINGSYIARDFPKEQPTKEWAGAVLDLLEDMKLGNYR